MASTYTFVILFARVWVVMCGTYIYNGGLAWLVPSMNAHRRSRRESRPACSNNNKRFHFVNESDAMQESVPFIVIFP